MTAKLIPFAGSTSEQRRSTTREPRKYHRKDVNQSAADEIVRYWAERGYVVKAEVRDLSAGNLQWTIKTDMIAGLPRELYIERAAAALDK